MNHFFSVIWLCGCVLCTFVFQSCGGSSSLDKTIAKCVRDGNVTSEEWTLLVQESSADSRFNDTNGAFSEDLLHEYIINYATVKMRGIDEVKIDRVMSSVDTDLFNPNAPIKVKFYLERSGSMTSYDAPTTRGDFKMAISTLLNSLPTMTAEDQLLYIVNDAVYDIKKLSKIS